MKEEHDLLRMFYFYGCLNITTHKIGVCMDAVFGKLAITSVMNSPSGYFIHLSIYLSIYPSISIYLSTYLPTYLPTYLSIYLLIYLSIYLIHLST